MKPVVIVLALGALLVGCSNPAPPTRSQRVTLVQKSATSFQLVPADGQPPYCHVFTIAAGGAIRQQTLFDDQLSPDCPAGTPIAAAKFRVLKREGKVKVYVIFSDKPLEITPLARQIEDLVAQNQPVTAMDLRAPGRVVVETLDFVPGSR